MGKLTEDIVLSRCRAADLLSVRKLNCWGSEIDDIKILRQLKNIEIASLSVNSITTLKDFYECYNLQELYIRKNKISNLNEICYLKRLPKLRYLWLADNPCASGSLYRMTVLKNLPNLVKLDNIVVSEEELNDAIEQGIELSLPAHKPSTTSPQEQQPDNLPEDSTSANDREQLTLTETNKIRAELGLKPIPDNKLESPVKPATNSKHRNHNILHAVLTLVKELDADCLESVISACRERMDIL